MKNTKFVFLFIGILFFSGCAQNVDLREQSRKEKGPEQKSISTMQSAVDSEKELGNPMSKRTVKILFVGDMMFDRHIREAVGKYGSGDYNYILEPLKEKLSGYDLIVGNLEGPITDKKSVSTSTEVGQKGHMVFTFDPMVAKVLFSNNIKLVNLGNNHILNQGKKGVEQTKKYLEEAEVQYFGDTSHDGSSTPVKNFSEIKVGFVGYNYSVPDSAEAAIENIRLTKEQSDIVIVCPHWGAEYRTGDPGNSIRALAYRFVDAGADVVIGTHPHVVQTSENYSGKKIFYSLGNFVFDQYFQKETMEGLGVEVTINPDRSVEFSEIYFEMTKRGQTKLKYPISNF